MVPSDLSLDMKRLPTPLPVWHGQVEQDGWIATAHAVADAGGRVVALWGIDRRDSGTLAACVTYATPRGLVWLELRLDGTAPAVPDLSSIFPCAGRMQRAMTDLVGINVLGNRDARPWLDHGLWPAGARPLQSGARAGADTSGKLPADYAFVRVEGDGVHEIAVGPVHAGIIEPGHFRFSVVGEKVLRLEEHLGYTHKGIERRFTELAPLEGYRLAGRVSGDSTVAYAWAYCMALESAWDCAPPPRASWLRA